MKKSIKKQVALVLVSVFLIVSLTGGMWTKSKAYAASTKSGKSSLPVIHIVMPTSAKHDNSNEVVAKINEILSKKVGANIDITWLGWGSYANQVNLMLTGEGEADIVLLGGMPIASLVNNGELLDLTKYYNKSSQSFLKWLEKSYIDSCRIDGKLYAMPSVINFSNEILVHVNKALADGMKLNLKDEKKIWTLNEIHDLVAKAVKKYHNIYGVVPQSGSQFLAQMNWDSLGDSNNIGVIENHGTTGKVVSIADCKEYIAFSKTMRKWYKEGLIMQDCMSNTEAWSSLVPNGKAFCDFDAGAYPNGTMTDKSLYYNLTLYPNWSAANCAVRLDYAIAGNTKNPDKAFEVLKELYNNTEVCNLLMYGIKGTNYVLNSKGKADFPSGVTLQSDSYSTGFVNGWVLPNMTNAYLSYATVDKFYDILHKYDSSAIKSGALGCVFDSTKVTNEYTACTNVVNKYYYAIMSGSMDTDSTLATFKKELKAAGEAAVIAEKQAQLSKFLASKKK